MFTATACAAYPDSDRLIGVAMKPEAGQDVAQFELPPDVLELAEACADCYHALKVIHVLAASGAMPRGLRAYALGLGQKTDRLKFLLAQPSASDPNIPLLTELLAATRRLLYRLGKETHAAAVVALHNLCRRSWKLAHGPESADRCRWDLEAVLDDRLAKRLRLPDRIDSLFAALCGELIALADRRHGRILSVPVAILE